MYVGIYKGYTPSGVDNTASTYGGIIFYRIIKGEKTFEKIPVKEPIEIVLANSGITADTKLMDTIVKKIRKRTLNCLPHASKRLPVRPTK